MADDYDEEPGLSIPFLTEADEVIGSAYLARDGELHSEPRSGSIPVALVKPSPRESVLFAVRLLPTKKT